MEVINQYPPFHYFPNFSASPKYMLAFQYHVRIWQVSPQLSCYATCQIWMWCKESNRYFCRIVNLACGEINEWRFSNPQSWFAEACMYHKVRDESAWHSIFTKMLYKCQIRGHSFRNFSWWWSEFWNGQMDRRMSLKHNASISWRGHNNRLQFIFIFNTPMKRCREIYPLSILFDLSQHFHEPPQFRPARHLWVFVIKPQLFVVLLLSPLVHATEELGKVISFLHTGWISGGMAQSV